MPNSPRRPTAAVWLASWGGCGFFPIAPGTVGSLGAVAVAWLLVKVAGWPPLVLAAAAAALLAPAVWAAGEAGRFFESEDPQVVVIDEVLGQWIALAAAPARGWGWWLAAFLLFRAFDIWKPPPARAAERLAGGWGIVADDLVAGAYAAVVLIAARALN